MNAEMRHSALACAGTLKSKVILAGLTTSSDETRKLIEQGKIEGISFPEIKKKGKPRHRRVSKVPKEEKFRIVSLVNRMKAEGRKSKYACLDVGVNPATYRKWAIELGLDYRKIKNNDK